MANVTFTQNNTHYELTGSQITLDTTGAVNFNMQIVTFNFEEEPTVTLVEGQETPVYRAKDVELFTPNEDNMWFLFYLNGEVFISGQTNIPFALSQPAPDYLFRYDFTPDELSNMTLVHGSNISVSLDGDLLFEDTGTGNSTTSKFLTEGFEEFDTTGRKIQIELELNRTDEDSNFAFLIRWVDNPGGDFIGLQSNKPEQSGLRFYSKLDGELSTQDTDTGISASQRIRIETENETAKLLIQNSNEEYIEQATVPFRDGNMFLQANRANSAQSGEQTRISYIVVREING